MMKEIPSSSTPTPPYILAQEKKQADLIEALRESVNLDAELLSTNLTRCQDSRAKRRAWGKIDIRRILSNEWRYHCKSPACHFCRDGIIEKRAEQEAQRFIHADPRDCSFVTIADSIHGSLSGLRNRVQKITRSLRYLRDSSADMWPRWRQVEMIGYVEPDPVWIYDVDNLAPDQNALISSLLKKEVLFNDEHVWVIRAHIRMRHEGIGRGELREVLSRHWTNEGQVHLQEFDPCQPATESAGKIGCYSVKHKQKMTTGFFSDEWPMSCRVQYFTWLQSMKRGLQPLRISVGPKSMRSKTRSESLFVLSDEQVYDSDLWLDPMPILV